MSNRQKPPPSRSAPAPRFALRVLEFCFRPLEQREFFVGDLLEEYRDDVEPSRGPLRARLWFWREVLLAVLNGWRDGPRGPGKRESEFDLEKRPMISGWIGELKYALRSVLRQRVVTGLVILTLALGIGSVTTVFNVVRTVLLEPLPYPEAGQLVRLFERHDVWAGGAGQRVDLTYATLRDLGDETETLAQVAGYRWMLFNLTGEETPERILGAQVTAHFFDALRVRPALGRFFSPPEYQDTSAVVLLSHDLWVNRYGADPGIVGRKLVINDNSTQVVGVMPEGFDYPQGMQFWFPMSDTSSLWQNRHSHLLGALARLRPGVRVEQAEEELAAISRRIASENPEDEPNLDLRAQGMLEYQTEATRPQLLLLLGAVAAVLLIGCVNVANLLTSQASARSRQFGIRAALGATRSRLIRQSLWESSLIAFFSGLAGLLIAIWTTGLFRRNAPDEIPRIGELSVNWQLALFALVVSAVTVFLFGLLPALRAATPNLVGSLREGERMMPGGKGNRTRDLLVIAEVALAMILLVGAGLLLNSFLRVLNEDLGFEPDRLLSFQLYLSPSRYREGDAGGRQTVVLDQILEGIDSLPQVEASALINAAPLHGGPASGFHIEGKPNPPGTSPLAEIRIVDPGYFRTLRIPLLEGRVFTGDDRTGSEAVMIVSRSLAERHLEGRALNQRLTMTGWGPDRTARVVGVVGDTKISTLEDPERPTIYWPYTQFPQIFNTIMVRTRSDPMTVLPGIREQVWAVDPDQPLAGITTMLDSIDNSTAQRRFLMSLVSLFSGLALLLASIGLYGVISYNIVHRIPEIGLRMALGATRAKVLLMVFNKGVLLTLIGIAIGTLGAFLASRQLTALLFATEPTDPTTYLTVGLVLVSVSLLACLLPARRALRIDPIIALRNQAE